MKKRRLGSSGISVNPIGLGAMPLSTVNRPTSQQAIHLICEALDAGIDFIDTADVYCLDDNDIGHNERLIAKAFKAWQGSTPVTVATKGGLVRPNGDWVDNGHPDHLKAACEASLIALDTETIDLYHFHEPDKKVPFEESMGALIDLKNAGKIRNLGLSNATLEQIIQARKMVDIVSVQDRCSPFDLDYFRNGIIDYCEQQNIAFLAYSPVGGGNGKVRTENSHPLNKVAQAFDATPYQIALAWLLEKSPVMIPIPGASRVENAISSADAMSIKLSDDDMLYLNQAFGVAKTRELFRSFFVFAFGLINSSTKK